MTAGVPLERGRARHPESVGLRGPGGWLPLQAEATERWPDGTIRWLLLDFPATVDARGELDLEVVPEAGRDAPLPPEPIHVNRTGRGFFVDTGAAQFSVDPDAFLPLRSARVGGVERIDTAHSRWRCVDTDGGEWTPRVTECALETEGPLRTVIRIDGRMERAGAERSLLTFTSRLTFWSGCATVGVRMSVRNPRRAEHPGGHWELGDPGSVLLQDLSLRVGSFAAKRISWSVDPGSPPGSVDADTFELYQESSGGENWQSPVHVDRTGDVPMKQRGYRLHLGPETREGLRATPRVALHDGSGGVGITVRHFWENFPKAIEADRNAVTLRLFPHQFPGGH
ncbi:MAG: hypothetical protein HKN12_01645, partial [Gemmatimonadetes bacterium]|nr:hypothetical protein [Gemmatimonadota bacterium]